VRKIVIIFMFLTALLFAQGCDDPNKFKPKLPVADKVEDVPTFVMENFKLTSTDDGVIKWVFHAKSAQIFEMKKKAYAQVVEIKYMEDANKFSYITADRAELNTDTNDMFMTGNVNLKASSGATLQTEKLTWIDSQKLMKSDEEVTIVKDNNILHGKGFESDVQMKNIQIKKQVKLKAKDFKSENLF